MLVLVCMMGKKNLKYQGIRWEWEWVLYGGAFRNAQHLTSSLHVAASQSFRMEGRQTETLKRAGPTILVKKAKKHTIE